MCQPITASGGHLGFPIRMKNTNFVEDLEYYYPVKFGEILCSNSSDTTRKKITLAITIFCVKKEKSKKKIKWEKKRPLGYFMNWKNDENNI